MTGRRMVFGVIVLLSLGGCALGRSAEEVAAFCEGAAALADGTVLEGVDLTALETLSATDPSVRASADAVAELEATPVPPDVAEPWVLVVEPLAALLDALREGPPPATDDELATEHWDRLRVLVDALVTPEVIEAGDAVDAYVAEHC